MLCGMLWKAGQFSHDLAPSSFMKATSLREEMSTLVIIILPG